MNQHHLIAEVFARQEERRAQRRLFLKAAGGASVALAGATLLDACHNGDKDIVQPPSPTQPAVNDGDILNFALNLEYLEANFYSFAATGAALPSSLTGGTGTAGAATGGRAVTFSDPQVAAFAREIAADERNHVAFLRSALGSAAVAQPAIDVGVTATSAFSKAAQAAGLVAAGGAFDAYANDANFLLAAFIFEDVGVTAYKGASPLITSKTYLDAAAGILAVEAYHAGIIRTALFQRGLATPSLIQATEAISNARDSLDGASDDDQGIAPVTVSGITGSVSNIVPTDNNGIAFSRNTGQVLDIVYLTSMQTNKGGFFPNGTNGTIMLSQGN